MVVLIVSLLRTFCTWSPRCWEADSPFQPCGIAATNEQFRWSATAAAVLFVAGTVASLTAVGRGLVAVAVAFVGILAASVLGTLALRWEVDHALTERWHRVGAARHGVVLMNPASGDGKAARFHLVDEAQRRGIFPVLLDSGDDLEQLAETTVNQGADVGNGRWRRVTGRRGGGRARHRCSWSAHPSWNSRPFALDLAIAATTRSSRWMPTVRPAKPASTSRR